MARILPSIDDVIDRLQRRGDARQHNWEEIRHYCRTKQYVKILRKLNNMTDDDDFDDAFEIVAAYVASSPNP
jgi:hypothetical protein